MRKGVLKNLVTTVTQVAMTQLIPEYYFLVA